MHKDVCVSARMPEIIRSQASNPKRRKKNKEIHNAGERNRKEKINSGINRIGELLPCSQALKQSKNMILGEAFRYITELKRQNDEMLLNGGDKVQAEEIKRLRHQLEDLQKESAHYIELLKANDINFLDDPTIHWKGKQRSAKVAKVSPTHLTSMGTIVYSNGNSACPTREVPVTLRSVVHIDQCPANAEMLQPSLEIQKSMGQTAGTTNDPQVVVSSSSSQIPVATLIPAVSKSCFTIVEQYSPLTPTTPKLHPPINYITLQNLCPQPAVTTPLIPLLQPDNPTPSFTSATKPAMAAGLHQILSISSLPQVVINNPLVPAATTMLSQDSEASSGGAILATSSGLIGTRATSSTQTTWTTLQLAGNTVQPVSQALATDGSRISCNSQQISLSSVGTEPLKHHSNQSSISMQLQSQEPTHIPVPSASPMSSLLPRPAIVSKAVVVHQPSVDAQLGLSQSSVRTQPALLLKTQSKSTLSQPSIKLRSPAQPAIATQAHSKPTVVSQAQSAIVPQLHLSVVPKAQPIIRPPSQPALVPKPQAATLPALQNMQLLQVNSDETPASVTSSPQNNAHVVILQQGSACPATQVIREDANKQTPCQHIVIIQTPALPPATHSHPTACVSTTTQTLPSQITSISSTNTQTTGTKQLLHILPRPLTQPQTQAPQTITVNGQVYVLQPSPDKGNSTSGQTITPFIQPACEEAPSNITMNCLGALTSLSQSIPKVSSQGNMYTVTSAPYTAVHPHPTCGSEVSTSNQTRTSVSLPLTAARSSVKIVQKNAAVTSKNKSKQLSLRKARLPKRKESKTRRSVSRTTRSKPLVVNDAGSKQTNSFCNEDLSKGNETRVETASHQVNAGSITSDFAIVSVDSTSQKSVDTSAILPLSKGSILKRVVHSGDISNEKPKSVDVTLDSTVTVGSPVPSTQGSIVSTNSESLNKKTGAPVVGPQLDCLTACSSSPVIVEAIATLSNSTSVPVNSSDCATFCNETVSQTSISSNIICVNNEDKSQSALILNDCSTLQSTASSTQINSKGKSVHSAPFQPSLSGTALVPSRDFDSNVDSSEVGSAASAIPNQSIIQDNLCRTEELRDSTPIQKLFDVHSTPVSKLSLPVRSAQFHESSDPFKSMNLPNSRNTSMLNLCHGNCLDTKLSVSGVNMPPSKDGQPDCVAEKNVTENDGFGQKDTTPPQRICTMQSDSFETPLGTNRQTESPLNGASGGRGFSVASLLPPGQNINASSNNFGAFTFTSEQAEILAMAARAIFEQDSPGKKTAECSIDKTINNADWDLPKMQSTLSSKDDVTDQQVKLMKTAQTMSKSSSQVSGRVPPVEPLVNSTSGSRLSQNSSYPHSQPVTVTSLNVNNLIRASSNQPYPQSPSLVQRVPASSSGGVDVMASQSSSQAPPNCSGTAHVNEYTPLKNVLMQSHVSVGMVERHQKDMSKRSAQGDLLLPSKRSKQCAPGTLGRVDIKAADHGQMMASQMPSSTSVVMTRNHSDSVGALFSSNNFMSTVNRAPEGHCSTQMPTHEQASMAHLQQGHTHHTNTQSAQSLTGNSYLKHQQQEQRHLYQLQHHLSQTEPQIHSIHQRNLLQEQHVHKKRGVVRGAQTGPNAGLQKQQHQQQPPPHQHQQQQQQHQQHHQQQQSQQQKAQQIQPQQSHQQQQQQQMQQNSHSRHQHLQQQIQQQQHFGGRQDKNCEAQQAGPRSHQNSHLGQSERQPGQDHGAMQRLMVSRSMEQQLTSQASNSVPRPSELACTSSRQDRHRLSSYSAEALIAKTSAAGEQRMHLQTPRNNGHEQPDLRGYVDSSRGKAGIPHSQSRLPPEHVNAADSQRLHECGPFKTLLSGHQLGNFDIQVSRSGDMSSKSGTQIPRGPQSQAGFRMATGATVEGRPRGTYSGPHHLSQSVHIGPGLAREQDGCHQSFMQSLLAPNLPDQNGHQRAGQRCTPTTIEYNCIPGTSTGELNTKSSSPNLHHAQKGPALRLGDSNKGHISHVSGILHAPPARAGPPLPPTPHSSSESGRAAGSTRSLSTVSQRPHPIAPDQQSTKIRQGDRPRSSNLRPGNPFETESSLTLPSSGVLLGRSQPGSEARRSIVRFMADGAQVGSDNSLVSDQHLTQNFGFSFIAESGMNPPPPINANTSFIPPVTQTSSSRTPALLPVETQNTLPSFYPSYSPATHPSLPSEIPLQYFSNQMFTSPSTEKGGNAPLNNRFGSILSPPRPVGFAQASFPLLTDITPMPIGNSSGIPPHLPNFNLTSLFPEIATSMPPDGSSMPMSPLLSLANTTASDSNKQSNRPAHNISHILGHDGTSAV